MNQVIHSLRRAVLVPEMEDLTDAQLLERFLAHQDEAAFEILLRRHGPMVFGVCQRVLGNAHDSKDAFQATFLVLVSKANSIRDREKVGNWLYGVAHRTALEARAVLARRRALEKQVQDMPHPQVQPDRIERDLLAVLDEELSRLPEKYRPPVVLCELEGRCRKEVARQLRLPEGTLSSRLATARKMLAGRLTRRGLVLSSGALAMVLAQKAASAAVPAPLVASTLNIATLVSTGQAAVGSAVSAPVAALAKGVLKAMYLNQLKNISAALLLTCMLGGALVFGAYQTLAGEQLGAAKVDLPSPAHDVAFVPDRENGGRNAMAAPWVADLEPISWGKPHKGLRVGLSPRALQIPAQQNWIDVTVWFENVGKEDVQVQPWDELTSFAGAKQGNPFTVQYQSGPRKAWPEPPAKITLKPGTLTRFELMIPIGGPEEANDFVGLLRPEKGAPLTLAAGWCATHPGDFPQPPNAKIIESGNITIELAAAVPPAGDPISWGKPHQGLRLGMTPGTMTVQPNQKAIQVMLWFQNVGKEDVKVHPWEESLRLTGQKGDKSFNVAYSPGERAAWPVPPILTLKPGILVRLPISIPFEGPKNSNDFVGLLRPAKGEPLTLAAKFQSGMMAGNFEFECGRLTVELATGK